MKKPGHSDQCYLNLGQSDNICFLMRSTGKYSVLELFWHCPQTHFKNDPKYNEVSGTN